MSRIEIENIKIQKGQNDREKREKGMQSLREQNWKCLTEERQRDR
jgi:hypothetical protein